MPIQRTPSKPPAGLRAQQILVIEDDSGMHEVIRRALQPLGYELLGAPVAEDGIGVLEHPGGGDLAVSLAILDVFMPGRGGIWALERIRERFPAIETLIISGGGKNEPEPILEIALQLGADMAIAKPFRIAELREAVINLIGPAVGVDVDLRDIEDFGSDDLLASLRNIDLSK